MFLELQMSYASAYEPKIMHFTSIINNIHIHFLNIFLLLMLLHLYDFPPEFHNLLCEKALNILHRLEEETLFLSCIEGQ